MVPRSVHPRRACNGDSSIRIGGRGADDFPIKATADWPDQHDSRARLLEHFWGVAEHVANYWVASVPELLWSFCPREHLPVARAKDLLSDWLAMNRAATFTRVFAPSTAMPPGQDAVATTTRWSMAIYVRRGVTPRMSVSWIKLWRKGSFSPLPLGQ